MIVVKNNKWKNFTPNVYVWVFFNKNTTTIKNVLWKPEAVTQRCFVKRVFSDLKKRLQTCNFIEKETLAQHRCFPVNFAKFVRTFFLQNTSGGCFWKTFSFYLKRLLLEISILWNSKIWKRPFEQSTCWWPIPIFSIF